MIEKSIFANEILEHNFLYKSYDFDVYGTDDSKSDHSRRGQIMEKF